MSGKRLGLAIGVFVVLMLGIGGAVVYFAVHPQSSKPAATGSSPATLSLVGTISITKTPSGPVGCNASVSLVASGSVSGSGTLKYQWERSDGVPPVERQIPVSDEKSFSTDTVYWSFSGTQTTNATMTFHLLSPTDQKVSTQISDVCK